MRSRLITREVLERASIARRQYRCTVPTCPTPATMNVTTRSSLDGSLIMRRICAEHADTIEPRPGYDTELEPIGGRT